MSTWVGPAASEPDVSVRGRYLPALDGVRALAIASVIAYHLGLGWARGGYLGVDLFFVLSGFLITSLLHEERMERGGVSLGRFWVRRARRLLPALLVLLVVLAMAAGAGALAAGTDLGQLRADALSTLAYVANWHQLWAGQSYFTQFAVPSPLQHTWSLAIEEQFYVLWPLALLVLWRMVGVGSPPARRRAALITAAAAVASAAWMAWLSAHGAGLDRLYYGTDTRAFELLAGATLALAGAHGRKSTGGRQLRRWAAPLALAGLVALWVTAGGPAGPPRIMFEGGMALAACGAVVVIADVRHADSPLARALSIAPLRAVGRISYGLYLWHWPVITEMTGTRLGLSGAALLSVRLAAMFGLAAVSYALIERPLRTWRARRWRRLAPALAPLSLGATAVVVLMATTALSPGPALAGAETLAYGVDGAGAVVGQGPGPLGQAPVRVVLMGDSVMRAEAPAAVAALGAAGATVIDRSFPGWGLITDPSWPVGVPQMLAATRPDVVVATWSWDDQWASRDPVGYRSALARLVATLLHPGGGVAGASLVALEQFPPLGAPLPGSAAAADYPQRAAGVAAWNDVIASLPGIFPGQVVYLPLAAAVERDGVYATWLPPADAPAAPASQWLRVRSLDNTHFCPAGAARYAAALAVDLHQLIALPQPVGPWWAGRWVHDAAVYDSPSGSCPDDHPSS